MYPLISKYGLKMYDIRDKCIHQSNRNTTDINSVIIHDTWGKTAASTVNWFAHPRSMVSAHYLIDKDGTIYYCVDEFRKAWHAGKSTLFGKNDVNQFSIGIEIVDDSDIDPYPTDQYLSTINLCGRLVNKYEIPLNRVVGHNMIAPGRKSDPGPDFPWYDFLERVAYAASSTPRIRREATDEITIDVNTSTNREDHGR